MIYVTKFRANDLNPSKGKQIEFNSGVATKFFDFSSNNHTVDFECYSINDLSRKKLVHVHFKLSPARGDYKIYQNEDGSTDLKDYFLNTLELIAEKNIDDYYAIKKESQDKYILYYVPKACFFADFFNIISKDQIVFASNDKEEIFVDKPESLQVIYYGAPGTGKSHKVNGIVTKDNSARTTFHPDSDYSTFVGAYKPIMKKNPIYNQLNGQFLKVEEQICYSFVPQAFLYAYVNAWKRQEKPYYLVIEEINRGNCAQIFGDLFQLLDRGADGESSYSIKPDKDITAFLADDELGFKDTENLPEEIKNGTEMRLPSNLYIFATMNTSDQSLFPIDSAFKRRWDWEYVPIENAEKGHIITIGNKKYDWWNFISIINSKIDVLSGSEDKKMGYWFVKPAEESNEISSKQFLSKVLFYLWSDIYKDYADSNQNIFRIKQGEQLTKVAFTSFFGKDSEERMQAFMEYNGIEPISIEEEYGDDNDASILQRDNSKYSINGEGSYGKGETVKRTIELFCESNSDMNATTVRDLWMNMNCLIQHLVETQLDYDDRLSKSNDNKVQRGGLLRAKIVRLANGENIYVSTEVGMSNFPDFMNKVNEIKDWDIVIEKIE